MKRTTPTNLDFRIEIRRRRGVVWGVHERPGLGDFTVERGAVRGPHGRAVPLHGDGAFAQPQDSRRRGAN